MKKAFAFICAMVLVLGCVGIANAEDKVTIRWLGFYSSLVTAPNDNWCERMLEDYFDINIESVDDINEENAEMALASGDILNVTCFTQYLYRKLDKNYLIDQEIVRSFPTEWLYEYYPTGMQNLVEMTTPETVAEYCKDDVVYATPWTAGGEASFRGVLYRKDWLDKLGLEEPKTLDELHDMLYAFTYQDPDGNGENDTYGMDVSLAWVGLQPVYGAFGISNMAFYLRDDGTVYYTSATDEYRQSLEIIKAWYDEGILDPEGLTDARADVRAKWANGSIGAMMDSATWILSRRGTSSIVNMVEDVFGKNTVAVLGPLTSQYGDGTVYTTTTCPSILDQRSLYFSADATDEQVITVLKMLEAQCTDLDLVTKIRYGEEGVDYTMKDGQLVANPDLTVAAQGAKGIDVWFHCSSTEPYVTRLAYSQRDREMLDIFRSQPYIYDSRNYVQPSCEAYNTYYAEVKKIEQAYYSAVMLGQKNLDSDWTQYLADMEAAGLTKITDGLAEALK